MDVAEALVGALGEALVAVKDDGIQYKPVAVVHPKLEVVNVGHPEQAELYIRVMDH